MERITTLLDTATLGATRKQFLGIDYTESNTVTEIDKLRTEMLSAHERLEAIQSGGDTFCYLMLYHFDLKASVAKNFVIIRVGNYPLYDVRIRVTDMDTCRDVFNKPWGEINAPADFLIVKWQLPPSVYYRIFFNARNGSWHQDLILRKSESARCWLAATRVRDRTGRNDVLTEVDNNYQAQFGVPQWR